jgi:quercetin dioxygenase-like cupin family protein
MTRPSIDEGVAFELGALELELRLERAYLESGYTARTLVRETDLRVVLVVMKQGARMAEHTAEETASLQPVSGSLRVHLPEREVTLATGQLLALERGLKHDVLALEESAFLLTLGWSGASPLP